MPARTRTTARWLLGTLLALVLTLLVFETVDWDVALQDRFYDPENREWIVDRREPMARGMFYEGPKYIIGAIGLGALGLALAPARWRARPGFARRELFTAFLTLLTVPVLVGQLKDVTNTFCPRQNRRYGGDVPYVRVFESYPQNDRPARRGLCFPAGHASGGFALIGLFWLRRTRRWRMTTALAALATGWAMGSYQMLNGSHYLSHTLATMWIAILVAQLWRLGLREVDHEPPSRTGIEPAEIVR